MLNRKGLISGKHSITFSEPRPSSGELNLEKFFHSMKPANPPIDCSRCNDLSKDGQPFPHRHRRYQGYDRQARAGVEAGAETEEIARRASAKVAMWSIVKNVLVPLVCFLF